MYVPMGPSSYCFKKTLGEIMARWRHFLRHQAGTSDRHCLAFSLHSERMRKWCSIQSAIRRRYIPYCCSGSISVKTKRFRKHGELMASEALSLKAAGQTHRVRICMLLAWKRIISCCGMHTVIRKIMYHGCPRYHIKGMSRVFGSRKIPASSCVLCFI
jgi:hypothetical protein